MLIVCVMESFIRGNRMMHDGKCCTKIIKGKKETRGVTLVTQ